MGWANVKTSQPVDISAFKLSKRDGFMRGYNSLAEKINFGESISALAAHSLTP